MSAGSGPCRWRVTRERQGPLPALTRLLVDGQPTCLADMPAAHRCRPAGVLLAKPSVSISPWAMASTGGVTSATCRHRDLRVIAMSSWSTDGAQSRNTVDGGGSSTTFSSAFAAPGQPVASSINPTCHRPVPGRRTRSARCCASRPHRSKAPQARSAARRHGTGHRRRAGPALPAAGNAVAGALQCGGETQRRDRSARPGRPGEATRVSWCAGRTPRNQHCEPNHRVRPARRPPTRLPRRADPPDAKRHRHRR